MPGPPRSFNTLLAHRMAKSFYEQVSSALAQVASGPLARPVTYVRGDESVEIEKVGVGRSTFEVTDEQGFLSQVQVRDYFIPSEDLVLAGEEVEPCRGDRIIETIGGVEHVYEVLPPGGFEPAWRWMDADQTMLRVHTKLKSRDCDGDGGAES
jgi:hypothetical protein